MPRTSPKIPDEVEATAVSSIARNGAASRARRDSSVSAVEATAVTLNTYALSANVIPGGRVIDVSFVWIVAMRRPRVKLAASTNSSRTTTA
ncbi:MAG: hypothetical protein H0T79_08115 [Deltaproteobacteria bacterium]|nr:hypothetical protein [Deltaproteobacteria bacterium]